MLTEGAKRFGSQCIVVAIDARKSKINSNSSHTEDSKAKWKVFSHGGSQTTDIDAVAWAKEVEERGAGEILLTSMDTDGHQDGFELELTATVSSLLKIPVIASGGGGTLDHFHDALTVGKADAVLAASVFHFGKFTVADVKEYLKLHNVPVRLV